VTMWADGADFSVQNKPAGNVLLKGHDSEAVILVFDACIQVFDGQACVALG
jgi:hypothetical protein